MDVAHFKRSCFSLLTYALLTTNKELLMQTAKYGKMPFEISSYSANPIQAMYISCTKLKRTRILDLESKPM
jgi:hypothetical protein